MSRVIVLVSDNNYLTKLFDTIHSIRTIGNYHDALVVLPHPELANSQSLIEHSKKYNYELKFFDLIDISYILQKIRERPFGGTDGREFNKTFQWHKMYLFHTYFKQWDTVFYLDIGMKIFKDINVFFTFSEDNKLVAHCDQYPDYKLRLSNQFNGTSYPELKQTLNELIDLDRFSFQTGILVYNTSIIEENTLENLLYLANKYHISLTNEQGVMNIYFNGINKLWKIMPVKHNNTYTYDFWERDNLRPHDYIMLKYPRTL